MTSAHDQQKERLQVLFDQGLRKQPPESGTYHSHTHDESGGRFAQINKQNVSGSKPTVSYPTLPASSPWSQPDPSGQEEPLGFDINEVPLVGTYQEIEASIRRLSSSPDGGGEVSDLASADPDASGADEGPAQPPTVVGPSQPFRKRGLR